jgi:hypothetical protein
VHHYVPLAIVVVGILFVAALVDFAGTLSAASSGRIQLRPPSRFSRAWPAATGVLIATFVLQESLEGALFGGHASGFHGLFGHGGWSVAILAPLLGALIAFLVRSSEKAIERIMRNALPARPKAVRNVPMRPPLTAAPRLRLLARNLAGRAPPLLAS